MHNHGLIQEPLPCDAQPLGSVGLTMLDVMQDGNWVNSLPLFEQQYVATPFYESMACVSFSLNNVIETQARLHGVEVDFSDRFLAKLSNTGKDGNTFTNVYVAFKDYCTSREELWPMPPSPMWETYYADPSDEARESATLMRPIYSLGMRAVVPMTADGIRDALKKAPLWAYSSGHAFVIYACDDAVRIFDTYPYSGGTGKRSLPLSAIGTDDLIGAQIVPLTINYPIMQFTDLTLYQLAEGIGGPLLMLGGKLRRDTEAKCMFAWQVASGVRLPDGTQRFSGGPVGQLMLRDIEGVQLYDLKGQPVTLGNPV